MLLKFLSGIQSQHCSVSRLLELLSRTGSFLSLEDWESTEGNFRVVAAWLAREIWLSIPRSYGAQAMDGSPCAARCQLVTHFPNAEARQVDINFIALRTIGHNCGRVSLKISLAAWRSVLYTKHWTPLVNACIHPLLWTLCVIQHFRTTRTDVRWTDAVGLVT